MKALVEKAVLHLPFLNLVFGLLVGFKVAIWGGGGWALAWGLLWLYILPPLFFRLAFRGHWGSRGVFVAKDPVFSAWWLGTQFQAPYLRFPFLEEILRYIPGLYSFWLRLWGARIGKGIFWGPLVLIVDRPFISIGDHTIVGTGAQIASHLVNSLPSGEFELFLFPVEVGEHCTLGGFSKIYPGARVEARTVVPALETVRGRDKYRENSQK